jgi:hypothetical protein
MATAVFTPLPTASSAGAGSPVTSRAHSETGGAEQRQVNQGRCVAPFQEKEHHEQHNLSDQPGQRAGVAPAVLAWEITCTRAAARLVVAYPAAPVGLVCGASGVG